MIRVEGFPTPGGPLDFAAGPGDVVVLEGPNGSGKTSLLRSLAGLPAPILPSRVQVAGQDPRQAGPGFLRRHVRLVHEEPRDGLVGLTVEGEFRLRGLARPAWLDPIADRLAATLSDGEARRVGLAVAEAGAAPVLLLDAVGEGLDGSGRARVVDLARQASEGGVVVAADPLGLLANVATRRIRLAPTGDAPEPARREPPRGAVRVRAAAASVRRGDRAVRTPDVAWRAGLHAVTGPNGSGKSTTLLCLAGLLGGGARVDGRPPEPGTTVRMLPAPAADALRAETVEAELAGCAEEVRRALVPPQLAARHPLSLSAGEAQRVALAKVLGRPAALHLLDEPEAHLDAAGRAALLDLLERRRAGGAVVGLATHDAALAARADTVARLEAP